MPRATGFARLRSRQQGQTLPRRWLALWTALLSLHPASALATDCLDPLWFREGQVKVNPGEIFGLAKHADLNRARRDARRDAARRLVKDRGREILTWPSLQGKINFKVYSEAEIARAMSYTLAASLPDGRRVKQETVCKFNYVAIAIDRKESWTRLHTAPDLGEDIQVALLGHADQLEDRRRTHEGRTAKAEYEAIEQTIMRLEKLVDSLQNDALVDSLMAHALSDRAKALRQELKSNQSLTWNEDRQNGLPRLQELATRHDKLVAAVRDYKAKNYSDAADVLRVLAVDGDEVAQTSLAAMHIEAQGVKRDLQTAMELLKKASAKNYTPAKIMIGTLLLSGASGKPNAAEASKWFSSAEGDRWSCEVNVRECRRKE